MPVITNIEDLRQMARRRVPKAVFDYVDRGSYDEQTLRGNRAAFAEIGLRQRVGWNVENRSTKTTMLGEDVNMPLAIAPTGLTGLNWANGEILGALAAEKAGIPFTLSTMSICSIEDVSAAVSKPFWFQLYVMRDRDFVADLIARAKRAKVSALMLTMDLQIQGQRHMDIRNGLSVPPRMTLSNALDMCKKIPWAMNMLTTKRKTFGNLDGYVKDTTGINNLSQWIAGQFDPTLSWDDVAWVKSLWGGKLIVKGVLDVQDARMAAQVGIDALVVSNHGGRQLDGASPAIRALPKIVEAIGDRTEVWIDGGIQSGQDVFKSLALGATGCLIGKAWLYGLGAMGEAGVSTALEIIRKELDVTMALTGNTDIREVTRDSLQL
jgi:L-lactate dehydrogenase (cytochrome)